MPQAALVEPLRRWDPEQIGGYTLIGRLGAGAMGRVYLGRSAAGRLVAVKTIKIEFAEQADFRSRFAHEVAAARQVSGAFTAPVIAADPEADVPWLATMYVPAPALSTLVLTCGPLSAPAVRWLAAGCAEALESIHGAGLVHRDLKPSNVLVSPDGPRVIDFGVARAAERIALTATRGAVGTPSYMAPEQARDTRQATTASDVYSLGATMLYAATGHGPYQGETVVDVLVRLVTEPPDLSGLPDSLAGVVAACLERDPRNRPSSAAVLAQLAGETDSGAAAKLGPDLLPGPALTLLTQYRLLDPMPRTPAAGDDAAGTGDEDTFGSLPDLRPLRVSEARGRISTQPGGRPGPGRPGPGRPGPGRTRARRVAMASALGLAAVILVTAGSALGMYVAGARAGAAGSAQGPQGPPGRYPPPLYPPPADLGGRPVIAMTQPHGDSNTIFVVRGAGWPPGAPVTVALAGLGSSPEHPVVDSAGIFSYAINQDHEFFPDGLPLGRYRVVVTVPGGIRATASFLVDRA